MNLQLTDKVVLVTAAQWWYFSLERRLLHITAQHVLAYKGYVHLDRALA